MAANPEYLAVLSAVVTCIRTSLHEAKLPDLTPQEVTDWLHSMTVEDVCTVWNSATATRNTPTNTPLQLPRTG